MSTTRSRGEIWFEALAGQSSQPAPVLSGNAELGGESAQFIAVVPDAQQRFPRAADNVVGLEQGWLLARTVRATMAADARAAIRRPRRRVCRAREASTTSPGRARTPTSSAGSSACARPACT